MPKLLRRCPPSVAQQWPVLPLHLNTVRKRGSYTELRRPYSLRAHANRPQRCSPSRCVCAVQTIPPAEQRTNYSNPDVRILAIDFDRSLSGFLQRRISLLRSTARSYPPLSTVGP